MQAMQLFKPAAVEELPLQPVDLPIPSLPAERYCCGCRLAGYAAPTCTSAKAN